MNTDSFSRPPTHRIHGGPDASGVPAHDFSTNSNACGPCDEVLQAVCAADAGTYPDPAYSALRIQLAAFHGIDERRILLAGSSSEFIFRISALTALRGRDSRRAVWWPPHSYGDYAQAATAFGLPAAENPADAGLALAWACEPSSPLGSADPYLAKLASGEAPGATVLDCAYQPLRLSGEATLSATRLDAVWQLFTPNKALGLTGVRAAYAIAPAGDAFAETSAALDRQCPSWPVGAHGVAMLLAWTNPSVQAWLAESVSTLRTWKARQIAICESLGWTCLPSDANFFCARLPMGGDDLAAALQNLRGQGIKLRDATSFGLPGHVRLGVLPPASQDALGLAWRTLSIGPGDAL
ncbi:MAG: aminotransferase class I/II-fold pyridoxal phosphate-dependent enzyme [Comamonadaceae bacterium]|nr:MAG: aminotransferase class I/II-fold pyridoxal phosphate-dependent enzyme [Comamonadaceae bacterium]